MKLQILPAAVAAVLGLSTMASRADTLLFSDNFDVTGFGYTSGGNVTDGTAAANVNLANRVSGTNTAGVSYAYTGGGTVGTGNTTQTYYTGNTTANTTDGNNLFISRPSTSYAGVNLNLPINLSLAGNNAITISFDMYLPGGAQRANINLSTSASDSNATSGNSLFALLLHGVDSGQVEEWSAGSSQYSQTSVYNANTYSTTTWSIVLSDVVDGEAGTGSAFAGNGTYVSLYWGDQKINGLQLGDATGLFYGQTLYLGLSAYRSSAAFDNLSITAVPEPASVGYVVVAGLGFVALAARRRVVRG